VFRAGSFAAGSAGLVARRDATDACLRCRRAPLQSHATITDPRASGVCASGGDVAARRTSAQSLGHGARTRRDTEQLLQEPLVRNADVTRLRGRPAARRRTSKPPRSARIASTSARRCAVVRPAAWWLRCGSRQAPCHPLTGQGPRGRGRGLGAGRRQPRTSPAWLLSGTGEPRSFQSVESQSLPGAKPTRAKLAVAARRGRPPSFPCLVRSLHPLSVQTRSTCHRLTSSDSSHT